MTRTWIKLLFLCVVKYITSSKRKPSLTFNDARRNFRLETQVLICIPEERLPKCIAHCLNKPTCLAVNFNAELRKCELLGTTANERPNQGKDAKGWLYYGPREEDVRKENCEFADLQNTHGEKYCCPKGKSGNRCQYTNICLERYFGYCIDTRTPTKTNNHFGILDSLSHCVNRCIREEADGCDYHIRQSDGKAWCTARYGGGYSDTEPQTSPMGCFTIIRKNCMRNTTLTCLYVNGDWFGHSELKYSQPSVLTEGFCRKVCFDRRREMDDTINAMKYDVTNSICNCMKAITYTENPNDTNRICLIQEQSELQ
eukprot:TCONS_00011164-protein